MSSMLSLLNGSIWWNLSLRFDCFFRFRADTSIWPSSKPNLCTIILISIIRAVLLGSYGELL